MNEEIRAPQVRVVGEDGKQMGIFPLQEALRIAAERGLDLVEVAPQAQPPVCRLMDYSKYRYEQSKRERMVHRRQRQSRLKSLRMRVSTDPHDFEIKRQAAERFLRRGHKVRFLLRFRGREIDHQDLGQQRLLQMAEALAKVAKLERPPVLEGKQMVMVLSPRPGLSPEELPPEEWEEVDEEEEP